MIIIVINIVVCTTDNYSKTRGLGENWSRIVLVYRTIVHLRDEGG